MPKRNQRKYSPKELAALRVKRAAALAASTDYTNDQQILTLAQWRKLIGVGEWAARTILANGGPPRIRLTSRRFGIRISDHKAWIERSKEAA